MEVAAAESCAALPARKLFSKATFCTRAAPLAMALTERLPEGLADETVRVTTAGAVVARATENDAI